MRAYRAYLAGQQRAALARLGGSRPTVIYSYRTAFAGFAARLTPAQVKTLTRAPEVGRVTKDVKQHLTSDPDADNTALDNATNPDSAAYLDLPEGIWQRSGGSDHAGDGVIVGVIDGGIEPGHPSFAATAAGNFVGPDFGPVPETWNGECEEGQPGTAEDHWSEADCNNKLIGARYFVDGFGIPNLAPGDSVSHLRLPGRQRRREVHDRRDRRLLRQRQLAGAGQAVLPAARQVRRGGGRLRHPDAGLGLRPRHRGHDRPDGRQGLRRAVDHRSPATRRP